MKKVFAVVALVWRVPLTVLSFCYFHVVRFIFRKGMVRFVQLFPKKSQKGDVLKWSGFTEMLKQPTALPYIMVSCPRWNTHAVIGSVGPFSVESDIDIQVETAQQSAAQWTFVIYHKDRQTRTYLSSAAARGKTWQKIPLERGRYSVILRYYNCGEQVIYPTIKIDGAARIMSRVMNSEMEAYQQFLDGHRNYGNLFYYAMHYHLFHLLSWKKWLPENFVLRGYLPTWNPNTRYVYGSMRKGNVLSAAIDQNMLDRTNLYLTMFNNSSFPVSWEPIAETGYRSQPIPCDGTYLIRVHGKGEDSSVKEEDMVRCSILTK